MKKKRLMAAGLSAAMVLSMTPNIVVYNLILEIYLI